MDALSGFARRWLSQQESFWREWSGQATSDAQLERARIFWDRACERWLCEVLPSLPPPLDAQARAAIEQTRLYLRLAGEMTPGADPPRALETALQEALQHAMDAASTGLEAAWEDNPGAGLDAAEQRAVLAYAALNQRIAGIAANALERARETLLTSTDRGPDAVMRSTCDALESAYLEAASGDDFARELGEWVNARIALIASDQDPDPGGLR